LPFTPVAEFASKSGKLNANITVGVAWRNVAVIADTGYQCNASRLRYYEGLDLNSGKKWPVNRHLPGPGPTLRARVGDEISIHLLNAINPACFPPTPHNDQGCNVVNQIAPNGGSQQLYPGSDTAPSCFHGDNITNLHYHGTHVSPNGHADNVMIDVVPECQALPPGPPPGYYRGKFDTLFKIPTPPTPAQNADPSKPLHMGQAPGTHWYHAHKHGSVALQLMNGMAGAFVIEGEFDDQLETLLPGLRRTEKVLVIQQLGDNVSIVNCPPLDTGIAGNPIPLVNGQVQPTITMQPGEIQRWRIVNATMHQTAYVKYSFMGADVYAAQKAQASPGQPINLNVADVGYVPQIRQIAYDGVQLAPEKYGDAAYGQSQRFSLAPANRIDILVQAPSTLGKAVLVFQANLTAPCNLTPPGSGPEPVLLHVNVAGASKPMSFPAQDRFPRMPFWLQWDEKDPRNNIVCQRTLKFNNDPTGRPAINGKAFDGTPNLELLINTAEEWILENYWASSVHPFHIHVNPFQVLEVFDPNAPTQPPLTAPYNWHDTIAIPVAKVEGATTTPGRVRIRSRFVDFPGTFVLHCHILDHEDRGMMQEVVIVDPAHPEFPRIGAHH
jgi:FtsP/CotA-like multicopper oxidase with cupredoxin domain